MVDFSLTTDRADNACEEIEIIINVWVSIQTAFFDMFKSEEKLTTIADLYPDLTAEEQRKAEEILRRYLGVVKRIYEHIAANDPRILTELHKRARLRKRHKNGLI